MEAVQSSNAGKTINLRKICIIILFMYIVCTIAFYFLAGEQLHYRDSRGNIVMPVANAATTELTANTVVEQQFSAKIQILEQLSVQWGCFNRVNHGTVSVQLVNLSTQEVLLNQTLQADTISEGQITTFDLPALENCYGVPLALRISSSDGISGDSLTPMMKIDGKLENSQLYINGQPVDGVCAFSVTGRDYIWTGLHYWKFVFGAGAVIVAILGWMLYCEKKGKKNVLVNAIIAMQRYRFLIRQLVSRDFKTKYKRSVLGVFWSFLNPLLTMIVQYIVFSNLFRFDIPYYPVYLLCGIIIFNYFSEACGMALTSILGNASLITKVYVPKYIYPLTRILSSMVNLLISIIPLLIVVVFSGLLPTKAYLLVPYVLVCLAVFCLGLGMLLAAAMVFFRDIQFLWGVLTMIWMYLTPIFYPESILPENVAWVLDINPLYYFVSFMRSCIINGISPEPMVYVQCALFALVTLFIGAYVFKKSQDKFILYL